MKIVSRSSKETQELGKTIAAHLQKGDILCLTGELGSGKTVFAKGVAEGLGIKPRCVISPTFVLIREHQGKIPMYHFDLYRLSDPRDIEVLGLEEYLYGEGVSVIEWSERLGCLSPKESLRLSLTVASEQKRAISLSAAGKRYELLLAQLKKIL
jgi:tRNA threonylcarbamoyladenosine biosynthesis protein TsaE